MRRVKLVTWLVLVILLLLTALPAAADDPTLGEPPVMPSEPAVAEPAPDGQAAAAPCRQSHCVYVPLIRSLGATGSVSGDREAARAFYLGQYLSSENVACNWTGSVNACNPGATSAEFQAAILRRINYFRTVAGVPPIGSFSDTYNAKAQAAALMMSRNKQLNHTPPPSWACYSADGGEAAGRSNLYLGRYGPAAISGYMLDPGANNTAVGHRRWILFPPTQQMGTGDVPPTTGYSAANDLWVIDRFSPRPATRDPYVAWPPRGYLPYQVTPARWSFSYPGADFAGATVVMRSGGANIALTQMPVANGYGDNTLVWAPAGASGDGWSRPARDTAYTVTVQNVGIGGESRTFTYEVVVFDPAY